MPPSSRSTPISSPTFFVSSAKDIFYSLYKYAVTFGDFAFLFLIIDKIDYKKSEEKKVYFLAIFAIFLVLALFYLFYSKYQVTAFMHNNALADLLVFSVKFNAVGRLDIVAMLTIMMITLFEIELMCYIFCDGFTSLFPLLNKKYAIVVFDVTNRQSFDAASKWVDELRGTGENSFVIIVGNKIDLNDARQVSEADGVKLSKELKCSYIETSALEGIGIDLLFQNVIKGINSLPKLKEKLNINNSSNNNSLNFI